MYLFRTFEWGIDHQICNVSIILVAIFSTFLNSHFFFIAHCYFSIISTFCLLDFVLKFNF